MKVDVGVMGSEKNDMETMVCLLDRGPLRRIEVEHMRSE